MKLFDSKQRVMLFVLKCQAQQLKDTQCLHGPDLKTPTIGTLISLFQA